MNTTLFLSRHLKTVLTARIYLRRVEWRRSMNMLQRVDEREADKENCGVAPPRTFKKQPQRAPLRDITNEKVRPLPASCVLQREHGSS
jgi:hypothetical protein